MCCEVFLKDNQIVSMLDLEYAQLAMHSVHRRHPVIRNPERNKLRNHNGLQFQPVALPIKSLDDCYD
jgi:hypothetical protein